MYDPLKDAEELLSDLKKFHHPYDEKKHYFLQHRYFTLSFEISLTFVSNSSIKDTQARIENEVSSMKKNLEEYILFTKRIRRRKKLKKLWSAIKKFGNFFKKYIWAFIIAILLFWESLVSGLTNTISFFEKNDSFSKKDRTTINEEQNLKKEERIHLSKNEVCVLYNDAKSINPESSHVVGNLESVMERYNKFVIVGAVDSVKNCSPLGEKAGFLTECGRKILKSIKGNLNVYIQNNKLNCY